MLVGIIDADLIGRKRHRFPNLACMKISAYQKSIGNTVELVTDYDALNSYDHVFLSKVFTDTDVPPDILSAQNVEYGGTGFFYENAPPLPQEIEHIMPDYSLYDGWVERKISEGGKRRDYEYFTDYSIGFLTRGCFRGCQFCVNKNYKRCSPHSPVSEFYDERRPKLCFLDDNFFACPQWREIIADVKALNRPFQFKQGLDERLLTDTVVQEISTWRYDGDMIFAFDNIDDSDVIERNLKRIYEVCPSWSRHLKFYVFCGFDRGDVYDSSFWKRDIEDTFRRIRILCKYSAKPYIMRYERVYSSEYHGIYSSIAAWCNQPAIFKKFPFETFCKCKGMGGDYSKYKRDISGYIADGGKKGATWRYYEQLELFDRDIADKYAHFVPEDVAEYGCDAKQ